MSLQLPPLIQEMQLDIQKWVDPLERASDLLKGFNATVGGPQLAQGVQTAKGQFESLTAAVAKYAGALSGADKDAQAWANSYIRQIERVKTALNDPTLQAGLMNRLKNFNPLGDPAGVSDSDVSRIAKQTIDAQKKAQEQIERYWMDQAAKTQFGIGRTYGMPFGNASTRMVGPPGLGGSFAAGSPMLGISPYQYNYAGFVGPEYPFKTGAQPFVGPSRWEQYNSMFRPSEFVGPEYPFKRGPQPFVGPGREEQYNDMFRPSSWQGLMGPPQDSAYWKNRYQTGYATDNRRVDDIIKQRGAPLTKQPWYLAPFHGIANYLGGAGGDGMLGGYAARQIGGGLAGGISATGLPGSGIASSFISGLASGGIGGLVGGSIVAAGQMFRSATDDAFGMAKALLEAGSNMQKFQTAFGVLLGDMGKGKQEMESLQNMSMVTPFSVAKLSEASQTLLGMGIKGESLNATMSRLGDLAVGDADRLKRLAIVYGEVQAEGKITGWRIRQLASLGIGVEDLAGTMGVSGGTLRGLMSANLVPGDILRQTITKLTNEGGRFDQMNEKILGTAYGQWNRLSNVIEVTAAKMGDALLTHGRIGEKLGDTTNSISGMSDSLIGYAQSVGDWFDRTFTAMKGFAAGIKGALGPGGFSMPGGFSIEGFKKGAGQVYVDDKLREYIRARADEGGGQRIVDMLRDRAGGTKLPVNIDTVKQFGPLLGLSDTQAKDYLKYARGVTGIKEPQTLFENLQRMILPDFRNLPPEAQNVVTDAYKKFGAPQLGLYGAGVTPGEKYRAAIRDIDIAQRGVLGSGAPILTDLVGQLTRGKSLVGLPGFAKLFGELSPEKSDRQRYEAFDTLRKGVGGAISDSLPPTALYGSEQAYDTIAKTQTDNRDIMSEILSVLQAAKDLDEQQLTEVKEFNEAFKQIQAAGV